jgi:hypothetical protein
LDRLIAGFCSPWIKRGRLLAGGHRTETINFSVQLSHFAFDLEGYIDDPDLDTAILRTSFSGCAAETWTGFPVTASRDDARIQASFDQVIAHSTGSSFR